MFLRHETAFSKATDNAVHLGFRRSSREVSLGLSGLDYVALALLEVARFVKTEFRVW
jgi:hypothetical protein